MRVEQKQRNAAWSKKVERKSEKEKRKEKKEKKKAWMKTQLDAVEKGQAGAVASTGQKRTKDGDGEDEDDWDELAREERMAKKVKKGVIDSRTFDDEFTGF